MASRKKDELTVKIIRDSSVWNYMPDPTNMILDSGRGLRIYDDMRLDARIGSLFDDRRNATHNQQALMKGVDNDKVQSYADRYLTLTELRKWGFLLLDGALAYGFQPAEIIWRKDADGLLVIDGLDLHDISHYRFDRDGNLFYGTMALNQEYKWVIHRNEGDRYNRPYGKAYLKRVYWPWKFKQLGFQFWLTATEKFSVPSIVALFKQSDPEKAKSTAIDLATLISQMNSGSGGALANVEQITQLSMGGAVSDFNQLVTACDLQIAYGMTGQALATNISDVGTQALGTVQERTKQSAYENDARALSYTLNKLIRMAVDVNFGPQKEYPEFAFDTEDYASYAEVMQAYNAGIPISRNAMYSRYGLPKPLDEDDTLEPPSQGIGFGAMGSAFNFADEDKKKDRTPMIVLKSSRMN